MPKLLFGQAAEKWPDGQRRAVERSLYLFGRGLGLASCLLLTACPQDDVPGDGTGTGTDTDTGTSGPAMDMPPPGCPTDAFDPNETMGTATPINADSITNQRHLV